MIQSSIILKKTPLINFTNVPRMTKHEIATSEIASSFRVHRPITRRLIYKTRLETRQKRAILNTHANLLLHSISPSWKRTKQLSYRPIRNFTNLWKCERKGDEQISFRSYSTLVLLSNVEIIRERSYIILLNLDHSSNRLNVDCWTFFRLLLCICSGLGVDNFWATEA